MSSCTCNFDNDIHSRNVTFSKVRQCFEGNSYIYLKDIDSK